METQNAGPGIWPNDPLFTKLLEQRGKVKHAIIKDLKFGLEVNYDRFLEDIQTSQIILRKRLSRDAVDSRGCIVENTVIGILSTGYEFVVAFYTILALGGVAFPIPPKLSSEEEYSLMKKVDSHFMIVGQDSELERKNISGVPIEISTSTIHEYNRDQKSTLEKGPPVGQDVNFSSKRPAVVLLTSSTTQAPKCVLAPRVMFYQLDKPLRSPTDATLCTRLPQRCTGLMDIADMIYIGGYVEIPDFDKLGASFVWNRLRQGGINVFPTSPNLLTSMKDHFTDCLSELAQEEQESYTRAASDLRVIWTGGHPLPVPAKRFWQDIRKGRPLMMAYGLTELGGLVFWNDISETNEIRKASMGTPVTTVEVKLTNGDHGELLLKKPTMYLHYVGDPEASRKTLDEDGFFKTGDVVHWSGGKYNLKGRASDFVEALDGSMVSLPDITESVQDLPYVKEAYVIAIPSGKGHHIAALVRLERPSETEAYLQGEDSISSISIERMRSDLSKELQDYELPTRLRVLSEHESLPALAPHRKVPERKHIEAYFT